MFKILVQPWPPLLRDTEFQGGHAEIGPAQGSRDIWAPSQDCAYAGVRLRHQEFWEFFVWYNCVACIKQHYQMPIHLQGAQNKLIRSQNQEGAHAISKDHTGRSVEAHGAEKDTSITAQKLGDKGSNKPGLAYQLHLDR